MGILTMLTYQANSNKNHGIALVDICRCSVVLLGNFVLA